jgi:hypothetical protein
VTTFTLQHILPGSEKDFSKGIYIILFNATALPPHLLLSINGEIFSITDSGRQMGSPLVKLAAFIKRKNVPAIFIEWKFENVQQLKNSAREHFIKYERVVEGKASCLFPVRDVAANILGEEMKQANFIFELLPLMKKANALGEIFELNMRNAIVNGSFVLLTYTNEQMKEALQSASLAGNS